MGDHGRKRYPVDQLLTAREVAFRLSLSEPTVRRLVRNGALRAVRIGASVRFRETDVQALIDARTH